MHAIVANRNRKPVESEAIATDRVPRAGVFDAVLAELQTLADRADRAYSTGPIRRYLRRRGIGAVIPQLRTQRPVALIDWTAYRTRNVIERLIARLKKFRRIATRYEKLAENYRAMLTIGAIRIMLRV